MPIDADALAWITLTRAPGLNVANLASLLEQMGNASLVLDASDRELARHGISAETCAFLKSAAAEPTATETRWLGNRSNWIIGFTDSRFPPLLRAIRGSPIALYVRGKWELLTEPQIAIVGSRNPTAGGRDNAFEFARYLATRGLTITSGLAEGIDTAAHRGALAAQGPTIAVLGTGIDVTFPRANAGLAEEIAAQGVLLSEFALQTPGRGGNFPQRNRIIAGLALGTLVVEAARQSGSLITARLAGEYGREVFALPGSIHNPLSRGCHQLIRQGAKLTETGDDILSELNFSRFFDSPADRQNTQQNASPHAAPMDKEHEILLDALGFEPTTFDELMVRTGFKPGAVSSVMLILELEGHVQRAPGGRYARVARSS